MLLLLLSFTVFGQLDTTPVCEPYGIDKCYQCAFAQDTSSFATHPDQGGNAVCTSCYTGYYPLAGKCYSMDELLTNLEVSVVNDIAIFQSDFLLDAYKTMWTWQSGIVSTDFDNYDTLGYMFQQVLGDKYDYLYVSSYEDVPALACAEQLNEEDCTYVATCVWEDETCSSNSYFPDRYHTHDSSLEDVHAPWQPYIYESKLRGVIRYNYKRMDLSDPASLTTMDMFGTHFHEIGHNFLVHGMDLNPDNPHWGYSVLERQGEMAHHTWLPEEVSCFETGEPVTSAESCPTSEDGKRWLHFEPTVEMASNFTFSDWELLPMGLLHPDDLQGQTFFFCASLSQAVPHEIEETDTGVKVGCNSVVFVTPEEWAWGEEYKNCASCDWQAQEVPFRAAHMVLQSKDQQLPSTHDELNAYWKAAADLLPELENDFVAATRGHGQLDLSISDPEPECYIFRDDHLLEGEWSVVGGLGAFTMEECEVQCTLREDCTAWRGSPYSDTNTYDEVTGEQNGMIWIVLYCTLYTGEVTYTPAESSQNNAYGPNPPSNTYWSGERVFPIPEGCEADGLTFPPTDLPTTAPSTEIPLCYLPHHVYPSGCTTEYPVDGEQITEEECKAMCSQDTECHGWYYPTWCTHVKETTCVWESEDSWSNPFSYQKNPDYFPESCVNPPTPEPTTTVEPTLHPTLENGLSPCYYQFTDAQVVGGQWDSEANISEEECEALCTADSECVGYSMQYDVWSSSQWAYYDKCWNYHGATEWNAGFYTWAEVITYKKVLPEPANCLPGATAENTVATPEPTLPPSVATLEPTVATLEPTMATNEPTEATEEPTDATSEPTSASLEPTVATLEPTVTTLEPTMATNEPTKATEDPTVATAEPTTATTEPTVVTQEPTALTFEPTASQTTAVKFTQVVSAVDMDCEEAKDDVQLANAQTLDVSVSSVEVTGCERRMLASASADTYEFLISVLVDAEMDTTVDMVKEQIADAGFAEEVSQRLENITVTASSSPVVENGTKDSNDDSEDTDSTLEGYTFSFVVFAIVLVVVAIVVCGCLYKCCYSKKKQDGKVCETTTGSTPIDVV